MNTGQQKIDEMEDAFTQFDAASESLRSVVEVYNTRLPVDQLIYAQQLMALAHARIRESRMLFGIAVGITPEVHPSLLQLDNTLSELMDQATQALHANPIELDGDDEEELERRLVCNEQAATAVAQAHLSGLSAVLHMSAALELIDNNMNKEPQREKSSV